MTLMSASDQHLRKRLTLLLPSTARKKRVLALQIPFRIHQPLTTKHGCPLGHASLGDLSLHRGRYRVESVERFRSRLHPNLEGLPLHALGGLLSLSSRTSSFLTSYVLAILLESTPTPQTRCS